MKVKSSKDLITKGLERHVICQQGMLGSRPNSVSNSQNSKLKLRKKSPFKNGFKNVHLAEKEAKVEMISSIVYLST